MRLLVHRLGQYVLHVLSVGLIPTPDTLDQIHLAKRVGVVLAFDRTARTVLSVKDDSRDVWAWVDEPSRWFPESQHNERVQILDTTAEHFGLKVDGRAWLTQEEQDAGDRYLAELMPEQFGHLLDGRGAGHEQAE
jgi:hypothetical protein